MVSNRYSAIDKQYSCQMDYKRTKTVETSTYGSELVAAKTAVELILEYRYILRMMGA